MRNRQTLNLPVKRNFAVTIYLCLTLMNLGCKKESTNVQTPSNNPGSLSSFILLDTTKSSPNDTVFILHYLYDISGRLAKSDQTWFIGNRTVIDRSIVQFDYLLNDTVPYKEVITNFKAGSTDTTTMQHFYRYDLSGRISFDSFYSSANNTSIYINWFRTYSYDNNKATQAMSFISSPLSPDSSYFLFDRAPATSTDEVGYKNDGTAMYHLTKTFDSHPNPFCRKVNPTPYYMENTNAIDYLKQQLSGSMNLTKVEFIDYRFQPTPLSGFPAYSATFLYTYEYDSLSRPSTVIVSSKFYRGAETILKGKFFYN